MNPARRIQLYFMGDVVQAEYSTGVVSNFVGRYAQMDVPGSSLNPWSLPMNPDFAGKVLGHVADWMREGLAAAHGVAA